MMPSFFYLMASRRVTLGDVIREGTRQASTENGTSGVLPHVPTQRKRRKYSKRPSREFDSLILGVWWHFWGKGNQKTQLLHNTIMKIRKRSGLSESFSGHDDVLLICLFLFLKYNKSFDQPSFRRVTSSE